MALLRMLVAAKRQAAGGGRLFVGHVDHSLRGDDSAADAEWLAEQCRQLALPLFIEKANVGAVAEVRGDGMEEAARATRYQILTRMAETLGARFVAFGHHRDDQVETILFRLLRGSGLQGLAGIPATRPLSPSVMAIRPLLNMSRSEIEHYLAEAGQGYRQDETNLDVNVAVRNGVRLELLPTIERHFGKSAAAALLRAGEQAAEAQAIVGSLAMALLEECQQRQELAPDSTVAVITLDVTLFPGKPPLIVSEALRQAWRAARWPEQAMTYEWWRRLTQFAQSADATPALNLPGDIRAARPEPSLLSLTRRVMS